MNIVEPIKSMEKIQEIEQILAKKPRNALLFNFGTHTVRKTFGYHFY